MVGDNREASYVREASNIHQRGDVLNTLDGWGSPQQLPICQEVKLMTKTIRIYSMENWP
jgi:hypothetical protein